MQLYLRLGLRLKRNTLCTAIQSIKLLKALAKFNTQKRTRAEKNGDKDGKALYKLMKNVVYVEIMENLRNRIDVKLVSNKKDYLKWASKLAYMSHKIFGNDLVAIGKSKVILTLIKPAYVGMC